MLKTANMIFALILSGFAVAQEVPMESVHHVVQVTGIPSGEGRRLRVDVIENNRFTSGYYFCANSEDIAYSQNYFYSQSHDPYFREHFMKFSICQDETVAQCQEFATDRYVTFRNTEGYLENDHSKALIDMSSVQSAFQPCEPDMDDLVKKSIRGNDRRFSKVG